MPLCYRQKGPYGAFDSHNSRKRAFLIAGIGNRRKNDCENKRGSLCFWCCWYSIIPPAQAARMGRNHAFNTLIGLSQHDSTVCNVCVSAETDTAASFFSTRALLRSGLK